MPNKNVFGFRNDNNSWFIGNTPVAFDSDILLIDNEKYTLTDGLLNLLLQENPHEYDNSDLMKYKEILLLTNVHKRNYQKGTQIRSNKSKKYKDIISKLFPPNRVYLKSSSSRSSRSVQRSKNEESEDLEPYDDVNQLVERLRELENANINYVNKCKIMSILKELERLGVIIFDK